MVALKPLLMLALAGCLAASRNAVVALKHPWHSRRPRNP